MVLKARATTKPKTRKTYRRRASTKTGRKSKRWNVATSGNLFGYKWNARLGTRNLVKSEIHKMRDNLHLAVNVINKPLTKSTINTLAPMAGIIKSTLEGDQDGYRTDTQVFAKYIHAKVNWVPNLDNIDCTLYLKLVRCELDGYAYVQGSYNCFNSWFSHIGWTDLFYNSATVTSLALPYSKRVQTLWQKEIEFKASANDAVTTYSRERNMDLFVKLQQEWAYKTDATNGHEGKKYQYFLIAIADAPAGTTGTTIVGKLGISYDLVYQNY